MRTAFFALLVSLLAFFDARATHIIGGEIYYDYLGNNNYKIYVVVYRDCATATGAPYDNPLKLAIYSSNNILVENISVPFPGSEVIPVVFSNPCVVTPTGFCNEKAVYITTVNLPPTPGGYTVSYQRCCRRPDIINIITPEDTGLTLTTKITGTNSNALVNSSPRFSNYPPLVLCNNDDLVFDHSAVDPDGDQLTYELITPFAGASDNNPAPDPAPPPPYSPIFWVNGFTAANPLGPGATISINPTTGVLTANPELIGMFVIGIRVKEFRNGVLIGQTDRDFISKVINCNITLQAEIVPQDEMVTFVSYCEGSTITFENESYGGSSYQWDFGVNGISTDVSSQFEPTFTFPSPGIYTVTLVVNPGWPCTDTSVQVFEVNEQLSVNYTVEDSVCFNGNSLDFNGSFNGPIGTTFAWDFGSNGIPTTSTTLDVNDVTFSSTGFIPVTLTATFGTCVRVREDSIYIYPNSQANFTFPSNIECLGLTVPFTNTSTNNLLNAWDFGVNGITTDVSNQLNPNYTFPAGGTYNITLIVNNNNSCFDTIQQPITIYEPLLVSFTHNDSLCVTNNSFDFDATYSGPSITQLNWNFGNNASIQTSSNEDVFNVVFDTSGIFTVSLTASFLTCSQTATSEVTVFREPAINFEIAPGLQCAPFSAQFIDLSISDTPILYFWDFGDGTTSIAQNPTHVYTNPGIYNVELSIVTLEGCVDTLSLYKPDYVNVRPSPTSKFSVDPLITDICNAEINFTDLSSGAISYYYNFDDVGQASTAQNPSFTYTTSGQKRPMQIVTNQFGCTDTSYQNLFIEPFTVYIPNTFTPDGNEFNGIFDAVIYLPVYEWKFQIFNRWGELLFSSDDPELGWDGTYNGEIVKDDTYTYKLTYKSCEDINKEQIITGHVNLLR
ncbi:MAG: PKD domain-containing protein [Crocinitomicaceae bacterium]|nr:MAG: PKD domain-containing protein [Crocinitomicaceae bacterium]